MTATVPGTLVTAVPWKVTIQLLCCKRCFKDMQMSLMKFLSSLKQQYISARNLNLVFELKTLQKRMDFVTAPITSANPESNVSSIR